MIAAVASAQKSPGGAGDQGRVYTGEEAFSHTPLMTYGLITTDTVKVKSGDLFTYKMYIGDKDEWKFYYTENGVAGNEIKTLEDTYVKFVPIEIQSTWDGETDVSVESHDGDAARYVLKFAGLAKDVDEKWIGYDSYRPSNATQPNVLLRDPVSSSEVLKIYFEISPR